MEVSRKMLTDAVSQLNEMEIEGLAVITTNGVAQKKLEQTFLDSIEEILEDSVAWEGEFGDKIIETYNSLITDPEEDDEAEPEVESEPEEVEPEPDPEVEVEPEPEVVTPKATKKRGRRGRPKKVVEQEVIEIEVEPEPEVEVIPEPVVEIEPEVIEPVLEMENETLKVEVPVKIEINREASDLITELEILCIKTVAQVDYIKANLEALKKMV